MINHPTCGTMVPVTNGFADCPYCGQRKLLRILPETEAKQLNLFCRRCKREMQVDIHQGQCQMSRSR